MSSPLHRRVLDPHIFGYFANDMASCLEVARIARDGEKPFPGRLNFTAALTILTVIEVMAGYYHGRRKLSDDHVTTFIIKYFSKHDRRFGNRQFTKSFYQVFRHGLVHGFSPKAAAVKMDESYPEIIEILQTIHPHEPLMSLNVPPFYELTMNALRDYVNDLDDGRYQEEFKRRYEDCQKEEWTAMRMLRSRFVQVSESLPELS